MLTQDISITFRKLRNKLLFWKILFFLILLFGTFFLMRGRTPKYRMGHIVRVNINGTIMQRQYMIDQIHKLKKDKSVKAIVLSINSPGGTATGAEALYDVLRDVAQTKPMVTHLETVAASGGYAVALAADHIVSYGNTLTGSIGVIMQWLSFDKVMNEIGISSEKVVTSPIKGQPNPFEKINPRAMSTLQDAVNQSYNWFFNLVKTRRHLSEKQTKQVANGQIFTGWQAVHNGLVDEIGTEQKAIQWLQKTKGIHIGLPITNCCTRRFKYFPLRVFGEQAISRFLKNFFISSGNPNAIETEAKGFGKLQMQAQLKTDTK